jgi:hypothetical protein
VTRHREWSSGSIDTGERRPTTPASHTSFKDDLTRAVPGYRRGPYGVTEDRTIQWVYCYCSDGRPIVGARERGYIESVSAAAQQCPPDVEEIAEAYCMGTLDQTARLAFEEHYLTCRSCASLVGSTDGYIRSMKAALRQLRTEGEMCKVRSAEFKT